MKIKIFFVVLLSFLSFFACSNKSSVRKGEEKIVASKIITKNGGSVESKEKDVKIEVPQNALEKDVEIIISEVTDVSSFKSEFELGSKVWKFAPDGFEFKKEILLTLKLNKDKPKGVSAVIATFRNGEWVYYGSNNSKAGDPRMAYGIDDLTSQSAAGDPRMAHTSHFSYYAIIFVPKSKLPDNDLDADYFDNDNVENDDAYVEERDESDFDFIDNDSVENDAAEEDFFENNDADVDDFQEYVKISVAKKNSKEIVFANQFSDFDLNWRISCLSSVDKSKIKCLGRANNLTAVYHEISPGNIFKDYFSGIISLSSIPEKLTTAKLFVFSQGASQKLYLLGGKSFQSVDFDILGGVFYYDDVSKKWKESTAHHLDTALSDFSIYPIQYKNGSTNINSILICGGIFKDENPPYSLLTSDACFYYSVERSSWLDSSSIDSKIPDYTLPHKLSGITLFKKTNSSTSLLCFAGGPAEKRNSLDGTGSDFYLQIYCRNSSDSVWEEFNDFQIKIPEGKSSIFPVFRWIDDNKLFIALTLVDENYFETMALNKETKFYIYYKDKKELKPLLINMVGDYSFHQVDSDNAVFIDKSIIAFPNGLYSSSKKESYTMKLQLCLSPDCTD